MRRLRAVCASRSKTGMEVSLDNLITNTLINSRGRAHVFQDLQPYLCTFPSCPEGDSTFSTRRAFVTHEMRNHRAKLGIRHHCLYPMCHATFTNDAKAYDHLRSHPVLVDATRNQPRDSNFDRFIATRKHLTGVKCPFCEENLEDGVAMLGRHLGRHMEEISFAVVTKPYEEWKFYDDSISTMRSLSDNISIRQKCVYRGCDFGLGIGFGILPATHTARA
jgi:hypothetical protein